METCNINPQC